MLVDDERLFDGLRVASAQVEHIRLFNVLDGETCRVNILTMLLQDLDDDLAKFLEVQTDLASILKAVVSNRAEVHNQVEEHNLATGISQLLVHNLVVEHTAAALEVDIPEVGTDLMEDNLMVVANILKSTTIDIASLMDNLVAVGIPRTAINFNLVAFYN